MVVGLVFALVFIGLPLLANAGIFSILLPALYKATAPTDEVSTINSQTLPILQATRTINPNQARGGGDITIIGGSALMPESGPVGTMVDVEDGMANETISTYVVRKGDTVGTIAKMFDVSINTVIWANNIKDSLINEGQVLVILPISGVEHTVKKGDTINSIAKAYKADPYDIARYNNIPPDRILAVGDTIIVPDGEISSLATQAMAQSGGVRGTGGPVYDGYYMRPIIGGYKSQGLHGYNAVDLATYYGAPIFASAQGVVIASAHSGWNGGYGKYIVIAHSNGTQTLYAHMSENLVEVGDTPVRGQMIGLVGLTGKSTGPHLHFEIRGAKNPF